MVVDDLRDPKTPKDVELSKEAPRPIEDPSLGIKVDAPDFPARHRLVTIGDSLTHGFRSLAIFDTQNSYPAVLARALGIEREFRYPPPYDGYGGLPLNLEWLLRELQDEFGDSFNGLEWVQAFLKVRGLFEKHEDYWERGLGSRIPQLPGINHNLGIYGWDLRDTLSRDAKRIRDGMTPAHDSPIDPLPDNSGAIAALRVLDSARGPGGSHTPLEAAMALGDDGGIETLIVWLGANNALGAVLSLTVKWSGDDYADLKLKNHYNVWNPVHFQKELDLVVAQVRRVRARHVLWATIPHVTVAPLAKGVGDRKPTSRYYPYYVRPWAEDKDVTKHPDKYPKLTGAQARAIDSAIDMYNASIVAAVRAARKDKLDWGVVDIAGVLERLAERRYQKPFEAARPSWWDGMKYTLPPELEAALGFRPTPMFLRWEGKKVTQGGLVGLDGVHPTCSGYGVVAHEFRKAMLAMGVGFAAPIDFRAVVEADALCTQPLPLVGKTLKLLGEIDDRFGLLARFERAMRLVS